MSLFNLLVTLLVVTVHGAGVVYALQAAEKAHTAQGGLAWALTLVFLPWVALPAYAIFGPPDIERLAENLGEARAEAHKRFVRARPVRAVAEDDEAERRRGALERLSPLPVVNAPPPTLLIDGDATFDAVVAAIDAAEHTVFVQFYIWRADSLGQRLQQRLIARARDGLRVCVLYDRLGSHTVPRGFWDAMRVEGVEVRPFEVNRPLERLLRLNYRNHRKTVIADGRVAILGGPNVGIEYLGLDPRFGPWRDTAILVAGAGAAAVEASFMEDWLWTGGAPVESEPSRAEPDPGIAGAPTLILPSGPADPQPTCSLFFCHMITEARRRIWIATPYFVPDLDVMTALKLAAVRGVDVRILIPDRPDHLVVWLAAFGYAEEAMRSGIKLYRYQPGFMHQKVCVVDDWAAAIGTVNLDNRSLRLNFEVTAVVFDPHFTREVSSMLLADFAFSRLYDAAAHAERRAWVRVLGPAARLLGPIL